MIGEIILVEIVYKEKNITVKPKHLIYTIHLIFTIKIQNLKKKDKSWILESKFKSNFIFEYRQYLTILRTLRYIFICNVIIYNVEKQNKHPNHI